MLIDASHGSRRGPITRVEPGANVQVRDLHRPCMEEPVVYTRFIPYLDRYVRVRLKDDVVTQLDFPEVVTSEEGEEHELLDRLETYFTGTVADNFDNVQLDPNVTEPRAAVLNIVRAIPYGEEFTVNQLVKAIAEQGDAEPPDSTMVREALAANPLPILIPDHRVSDGPSGAPPIVEQRLRSLEQHGG